MALFLLSCNPVTTQTLPSPTPPTPETLPSTASTPTPSPSVSPNPSATPSTTPVPQTSAGYPSCVNSDKNHQCIGLKLVSYYQGKTPTIVAAQDARSLVDGINFVWSQCNIGFQLEKYVSINPSTVGLSYDSDWENDADLVRDEFDEQNTFLVVAVGTLTGSTIAVTQMPGYGPFGVLVEALFAHNSLTVGHELGHYMGLYHISDNSNLMNPYIGSHTSGITASQCQIARSTNKSEWPQMMR